MEKMIHLSVGGPTHQINVRGRQVPFEMHPYCGPTPVHKITGDPLLNTPPGFWDAIDLWIRGGKKMDGETAVVPAACADCDGSGDEMKHLGGKHYELVGRCKACKGKGVIHKRENQ